MIYEFVVSFIVLNIVFELVEIIFPSERMSGFVKSFSLMILLYVVIKIFI